MHFEKWCVSLSLREKKGINWIECETVWPCATENGFVQLKNYHLLCHHHHHIMSWKCRKSSNVFLPAVLGLIKVWLSCKVTNNITWQKFATEKTKEWQLKSQIYDWYEFSKISKAIKAHQNKSKKFKIYDVVFGWKWFKSQTNCQSFKILNQPRKKTSWHPFCNNCCSFQS